VDKYGRKLSGTHDSDNLRRFYRLEDEEEESPQVVDLARGEVLMESSDEGDGADASGDGDSDEEDGVITLGKDETKPIRVPDSDEEAEIDLNEDNFADLDAQATSASHSRAEQDDAPGVDATLRIAIVNLDWDHIRARHLWKIISSVLTASTSESSKQAPRKSRISRRGRLISVRVYPSEFGKERMAREEKEGPPPEVFNRKTADEDEVDETDIIEVGQGQDYDEDALRRYQLDRMRCVAPMMHFDPCLCSLRHRYYYAIAEFDSIQAASHVYSELEGAELERSANVFDLSYVPDGMTFDEECR
jgi:hypothetical protein